MMNRVWTYRLRHWVIEPVVIGYAVAGVTAIYMLPGVEGADVGRVARVCNYMAYHAAIAVSFFRIVVYGALLLPKVRRNLDEH